MELVGTRLLSQLPEGAEEDDEHESKEKVLHRYFLQEWKIVKSLLDDIFSARRVTDLSAVARIRSIMDKYQEQGQLVEPYLESIVAPLMAIVRSRSIDFGSTSNEIVEVIKPICIIIYSLVTVCGYKSVIKFFPHQVSDLELAVSLLDKCHCTNAATSLRQESTGEMETKCVILLWLSILVLIPFDISSVDTTMANCKDDGKDEPPPLVMKILEHCKDYLSNAGPMRSIAGLLLARLLTRSDMSKAFDRFIVWADQILSTTNENIIDHFRLLGVVEALAAIFKTGSRSLLLNVAPIIWNRSTVLIKCTTATRSSLLRKYLVKLTQRIGLICLPHHSATWRYMGRNNTLGLTQKCNWLSHSVNMKSDAYQDMCCLDEDDTDVPDIIEDIIELLLSGLRDTDTVVRWSAAKGIGRVTSRLSYSLSDEVLSSVLELFSACEGDGSWHGGCLALAELARRGLLLPISFPKVVPLIIKALHYDIRRGPHSIGSHVRDAAAYVCWAFGRVYYHGDMKNVLEELAPHLLTVACYDREVNCRRAAAAAFQENVGRQGNFPHGIDIVNLADYFALSSRVKSYLHVAVCIAQYDCYLHHFVYELIQSKICHWDKSLRELSASALSSLVQFDKEHFANVILENLAPCTLSSDLCMRHGATLSIAEVILALRKQNYSLSPDKQRVAAGIVPGIEKARLYRGKSGEIMRSAVCRFIECISMSQVSLTEKTKRNLLDSLDENLKHPNPLIQNAAIEALRHYITAYIPLGGKDGVIVSRYLEQLTDPNVAARRGSALALGVLPCDFLEKVWKSVLSKLCCSCQIEGDPNDRDPQSRVNAVKALVSVCETLTIPRESSAFFSGEDALELFLFIRDEVMSSLFKALDDYSTDNRGDVGSWVREAAMDGLERCTYILCKRDTIKQEKCWALEPEKSESYNSDKNNSSFNVDLAHKLVGGLVKQAVEKMDKLRESAAQILQRILYNKTVFVAHIPERETLESLIPDKVDLKWGVPTFSFPCFVQLLQVSSYSKYVASGLVISIGGLQESLRKASLSSLLEYLESTEAEGCNDSKVYNLSMDMLWILENSKKCDRVIIPTLKTIEILFSRGLLLHIEDHTPAFCASVLDSLALELKGTKDFSKLYSGIAILGYIASLSDPISIMAFSNLLTFLGHRYPKIRKSAAEQVYLVLLGNGNLMADDKLDEATDIIAETCWEGDIKEAKKRRLQLCQMANIRPAQTATASEVESKKIVQQKMISADENASYSSLVGSAGF